MKSDAISFDAVTAEPVIKNHPAEPLALSDYEAVIPDECGDSLWEKVLLQDTTRFNKQLPAKK